MQFIILDLEAVGKKVANDFQEIIEIAAYKVKPVQPTGINQGTVFTENIISNHKQYMIMDEFHEYIQPVFHTVTKQIYKLTHIDNKCLNQSEYFYEVMEKFKQWVGDENTRFIAWSENDRVMLEDNAREHYVFLRWITDNYFDLQQEYGDIYMIRKSTNLNKALIYQGIVFNGVQHNALDDSFNTYLLFNDMQISKKNRLRS